MGTSRQAIATTPTSGGINGVPPVTGSTDQVVSLLAVFDEVMTQGSDCAVGGDWELGPDWGMASKHGTDRRDRCPSAPVGVAPVDAGHRFRPVGGAHLLQLNEQQWRDRRWRRLRG